MKSFGFFWKNTQTSVLFFGIFSPYAVTSPISAGGQAFGELNLLTGEQKNKGSVVPINVAGSGANRIYDHPNSSATSIYFCGGISGSTSAPSSSTYRVSKANKALMQIGNMPAGRTGAYHFGDSEYGYIASGSDWSIATPVSYTNTFRLNYSNETWSSTTATPWGGKGGHSCHDEQRQFGFMGGGWSSNSGPTYRNNWAKFSFATQTYSSYARTFNSFLGQPKWGKVFNSNFGYITENIDLGSGSSKNDAYKFNFSTDAFQTANTANNSWYAPFGCTKTKGYFFISQEYLSGSGTQADPFIYSNSQVKVVDFSTDTFYTDTVLTQNFNDPEYLVNYFGTAYAMYRDIWQVYFFVNKSGQL